jgi:hypothetical protein
MRHNECPAVVDDGCSLVNLVLRATCAVVGSQGRMSAGRALYSSCCAVDPYLCELS